MRSARGCQTVSRCRGQSTTGGRRGRVSPLGHAAGRHGTGRDRPAMRETGGANDRPRSRAYGRRGCVGRRPGVADARPSGGADDSPRSSSAVARPGSGKQSDCVPTGAMQGVPCRRNVRLVGASAGRTAAVSVTVQTPLYELGSGASPRWRSRRPTPLDGSGAASHGPRSQLALRSRADGRGVRAAPPVRQVPPVRPTGRHVRPGLDLGACVAAGTDRPSRAEVGRTGGPAPTSSRYGRRGAV